MSRSYIILLVGAIFLLWGCSEKTGHPNAEKDVWSYPGVYDVDLVTDI